MQINFSMRKIPWLKFERYATPYNHDMLSRGVHWRSQLHTVMFIVLIDLISHYFDMIGEFGDQGGKVETDTL